MQNELTVAIMKNTSYIPSELTGLIKRSGLPHMKAKIQCKFTWHWVTVVRDKGVSVDRGRRCFSGWGMGYITVTAHLIFQYIKVLMEIHSWVVWAIGLHARQVKFCQWFVEGNNI